MVVKLIESFSFLQQIACKDELKSCVSGASGILAKAACFKDFGKCLINKGPSPPAFDAGEFVLNAMEDEGPAPTRHPYLVRIILGSYTNLISLGVMFPVVLDHSP